MVMPESVHPGIGKAENRDDQISAPWSARLMFQLFQQRMLPSFAPEHWNSQRGKRRQRSLRALRKTAPQTHRTSATTMYGQNGGDPRRTGSCPTITPNTTMRRQAARHYLEVRGIEQPRSPAPRRYRPRLPRSAGTSAAMPEHGCPAGRSTPIAKAISVAAGMAQPLHQLADRSPTTETGIRSPVRPYRLPQPLRAGGVVRGIRRVRLANQFALHFQADDEEEYRHQPVIDPQMQARRAWRSASR